MAKRYYKVRAINPSFDPRQALCCNPCGRGEVCISQNPAKYKVKVVWSTQNPDVVKASATGKVRGIAVKATMRPIHTGLHVVDLGIVSEHLNVVRAEGGHAPPSAHKIMAGVILDEIEHEMSSRRNPELEPSRRIRNLARRLARGENR